MSPPPRLLGALLACLAAACVPPRAPGTASGPPPGEPSTAPAAYARLEADIHAGVNAYRAAQGLPPLRFDDHLARVARQHSEAMAAGRRPLGHQGMDERTAEIARVFSLRALAENVAYDNRADLAGEVVRGWVRSSGHRANIVGGFELTGVGVARNPRGVYYFTQIFVARR